MTEELVRQLRESSSTVDPVPEAVLHAARTAFAWAGDDISVVGIARDSALDELSSARGADDARVLELAVDDVRVWLEIVARHRRRSITGQLHPSVVSGLRERRPDGTTAPVAVDALGRFSLDDVAPGPFSLGIDLGGRQVVTEWVAL